MDNNTALLTLEGELQLAINTCWDWVDDLEERGGIILHHKDKDSYCFMPLRNANTGKPNAPVLFTADRAQYAKEIIPMFKSGWKHYASFHTHPQFPPWPSHIDMNELFPGFPINYIYSGLTDKLMKYSWIDPTDLNVGVIPEEINLNEPKS